MSFVSIWLDEVLPVPYLAKFFVLNLDAITLNKFIQEPVNNFLCNFFLPVKKKLVV